MVVHDFTVDLNKPLVFRVGHLEEHYQEWVHQPIISKEGPCFFGNDVMEFLTRTKWWVVPVIWLPVVCWLFSKSIQMGHTVQEVILMALFGVFVWTLIEYTLHRFLFHIETKSYWSNTAHYLIHGCHHKHPMDSLRLVFPPVGTSILCVPFWNIVVFFATPSTTPALFGGGLLGYVMYDCTHYYLHHGQPSKNPAKHLKVTFQANMIPLKSIHKLLLTVPSSVQLTPTSRKRACGPGCIGPLVPVAQPGLDKRD